MKEEIYIEVPRLNRKIKAGTLLKLAERI